MDIKIEDAFEQKLWHIKANNGSFVRYGKYTWRLENGNFLADCSELEKKFQDFLYEKYGDKDK